MLLKEKITHCQGVPARMAQLRSVCDCAQVSWQFVHNSYEMVSNDLSMQSVVVIMSWQPLAGGEHPVHQHLAIGHVRSRTRP